MDGKGHPFKHHGAKRKERTSPRQGAFVGGSTVPVELLSPALQVRLDKYRSPRHPVDPN